MSQPLRFFEVFDRDITFSGTIDDHFDNKNVNTNVFSILKDGWVFWQPLSSLFRNAEKDSERISLRFTCNDATIRL